MLCVLIEFYQSKCVFIEFYHVYSTGMGSKEAFEHVQQGYRMPLPDLCPAPVYDVILQCWNSNAISRPNFDSLNTYLHDFQSSS